MVRATHSAVAGDPQRKSQHQDQGPFSDTVFLHPNPDPGPHAPDWQGFTATAGAGADVDGGKVAGKVSDKCGWEHPS